ncbi:MAG: transporter [Steroidobacteraceae bacterium]
MRQTASRTSPVIKALLTLAFAQTAAHAAPGTPPAPPQPMVGLGTTTMLDAEGGVGSLFQVLGTGYHATRINNANGKEVPVDFKQNAQGALLHYVYTSNIQVLGAHVGGEIILPVAHVNLHAGPVQDSTSGVGDTILGFVLQWHKLTLFNRPFSARFDLNVVAPTGSFDRDEVVNLGNKLWQISPYIATTLRVTDRWEVSNRINYNWSGVSHRPPYGSGHESAQPGDQLAVNLSASYGISETWRVGVGSYMLRQLSDSRTDGADIADSRQRVFGAGPTARWSHGRTMVIISAYKEFEAENRSQGYQGVLRLMRVF